MSGACWRERERERKREEEEEEEEEEERKKNGHLIWAILRFQFCVN